jgi:pimeloyl-ACP methyl ester carboxylesterase
LADPRIQYVTSGDGVRVAYASIGEGDPIVFAANVWGDIELAFQVGPIYGGLIESLLRNNFRVVVYDGRGCGASDRGAPECRSRHDWRIWKPL